MEKTIEVKRRILNVMLHLRLPFSYFLLPVFIFGLSQSTHIDLFNSIIIFISLHFFIYPASNSYNSFMDRDTGSIGALKTPPPVTNDIYMASIFLDLAGLALMFLIDVRLFFLMIVYIAVSKAYSWHGIRLKKYPVTGWLVVVLFQGGYTFLLVSMTAENDLSTNWFTLQSTECMLLSTLLIGAYYPLTQIYQHEEDKIRGDFTISFRLGITGTFIFSAMLFLISFAISFHYFSTYYDIDQFFIFSVSLMPAIAYFIYWFINTLKSPANADYRHTMNMTFISSTCLLISFIILLFINHPSTPR